MSSQTNEKRRNNLMNLRRSLTLWIPRRKDTIERLQKGVDGIKKTGRVANWVKYVGSTVSAAYCIIAFTLVVMALFNTRGLPASLLTAGLVASAARSLATVVSCRAKDFKAVKMSKLLEEASKILKKEIDEYMTVIKRADKLNHVITSKIQFDCPFQVSIVSTQSSTTQVAINFLTASYFLYSLLIIHMAETASTAAAKEAATAAINSYWGQTTVKNLPGAVKEFASTALQVPFYNPWQTASVLVYRGVEIIGSLMSKSEVINLAIKAAEKAANSTITSSIVSTTAIQVVVQAAGEAAGKTAEAIAKTSAIEVVEAEAQKAASLAATEAAKTAFIEVTTLGVLALSFINLGFAVWELLEAAKVCYVILYGMEEETMLENKIHELREEANKIVADIYNYLADDMQSPELPLMDPPFPG